MFKKQDEEFDEMAADPIRRRAKIADLSGRRNVISCCIFVMVICAFVLIWTGARGAPAFVLIAAFSWGNLIKHESDLRLLRVIERLHRNEKMA